MLFIIFLAPPPSSRCKIQQESSFVFQQDRQQAYLLTTGLYIYIYIYKVTIGAPLQRKRKKQAAGLDIRLSPFPFLSFRSTKSVAPGIEELGLSVPTMEAQYNFPCPLLSNGSGGTVRHLHHIYLRLAARSTPRLTQHGYLLHAVETTGDELGTCLLCSSFALERLRIRHN
jgi:hypothetical protein